MSPYSFYGSNTYEFLSNATNYSLDGSIVYGNNSVRTVINLNPGILFKDGVGTIDSPYTVKVS